MATTPAVSDCWYHVYYWRYAFLPTFSATRFNCKPQVLSNRRTLKFAMLFSALQPPLPLALLPLLFHGLQRIYITQSLQRLPHRWSLRSVLLGK